MISADLNIILPEIVLAVFAMLGLLGAVYTTKDKAAGSLVWLTAGLFVIMAAWIGLTGDGTQVAFGGMFNDDGFSRFAKITILLSAACVLMMSEGYMKARGMLRFEYPVLITLAVVGMMMMVSAGDLMALYMGLELEALTLYVVASMRRDSVKSSEAGLKYFVLGALASGLLLYGASLVYGYAGTTLFSGILQVVQSDDMSLGLLFGLVFLIVGFAFKMSIVPFHMWTPDVYQGAPTPVTAFFSTAPKVSGVVLFTRLLFDGFGGAIADWQQILAVLAVASMFWGSVGAIGQTNIKRMMAYSTIAHMGFALMGLAAGTVFGVQAMLIYVAIYVTVNIGTFAFIMMMTKDGAPVTDISSLNMFSKQHPGRALAMLVLMFSLAGVPPMLGFFGKLYVLRAAYEGGLAWVAVAGVIASVIGAYYYLRIVFYMYFGDEKLDQLDKSGSPLLAGFVTASAVIMVVGIINMFGVDSAAALAAATLVN